MLGLSSSIVLAAADPAALAAFYAALLEVEAIPCKGLSHWRVRWPAGGQLEIHAPSRARPQPHQGVRMALCLQKSSEGSDGLAVLTAWLEVAAGVGAELPEPPRQEPFGAEAWLLDLEGNRLLLLVS